jgi:hypothetical protein
MIFGLVDKSVQITVDQKIIFKLVEEVNASLLLLPKLFVETAVFGSASGLGCWLVVGDSQASNSVLGVSNLCCDIYPRKDRSSYLL